MSKGKEAERRIGFEKARHDMGRQMTFYSEESREGGMTGKRLTNSDGMLWMALSDRYGDDRPLMSEVAADLGVNDELTRVILQGKREPSKAFLDAVGYERVTLYRRVEK